MVAYGRSRNPGPIDEVAWERPADWLPVPVPSASDQRFVGLAAVFNNGANFITVRSDAVPQLPVTVMVCAPAAVPSAV